MTLTTKQIEQAQDLIEKYGFCTLETQKELREAGFFEKVMCNLRIFIPSNDTDCRVVLANDLYLYGDYEDKVLNYSLNKKAILPMPQMGEVWRTLPKVIKLPTAWSVQALSLDESGVYYHRNGFKDDKFQEPLTDIDDSFSEIEVSETEAMCRLWLKLHKENLL